jgi:hypothetical protein
MGAMASAGSLGRFIGPFMAAGLAGLHPGKYEYAFWLASAIMAMAAVAVARIRMHPPSTQSSASRADNNSR